MSTAPVILSNGSGTSALVAIAENTTFVTSVFATDADPGTVLTYAITGGADAARFSISATTGALRFINAPNYEVATDSGLNNVYDVIVRASDGLLSDSQVLAVRVLNTAEPMTAPLAPTTSATVSINNLFQTGVKVLYTLSSLGAAGFSVAGAGDVNGDGYADLLIGAPLTNKTVTSRSLFGTTTTTVLESAGAVYVAFGQSSSYRLDTLDGNPFSGPSAPGFMIVGALEGDQVGTSVAAAGDVNGDGFADIIIGAKGVNSGTGFFRTTEGGASYVIFGKASGFGKIDLGAGLSPTQGFMIRGFGYGDYLGNSVASAGDINGDGYSDLIVGAPRDASAPGRPTLCKAISTEALLPMVSVLLKFQPQEIASERNLSPTLTRPRSFAKSMS
jgi:hypothetical protein